MTEPYARFIILGQGRTGSTLLVQALNSHPQIMCFGEIFNFSEFLNAGASRVEWNIDGYSADEDADRALRSSDYRAFLRERVFCAQGPALRAVGFKFHYDHVWEHDESLAQYFADDIALRVIHLTRRNRLRTLVSLKLAMATGRWFEYERPAPQAKAAPSAATMLRRLAVRALKRRLRPPPPTPRRSTEIGVEEFREFCAKTTEQEAHWSHLIRAHPVIELDYERLAAEREEVFDEVERFLGVEPAPPVTTLRRQNPEPLRELVANYDELRAAFAGTPEEGYFND